jgi:hypothetical protein
MLSERKADDDECAQRDGGWRRAPASPQERDHCYSPHNRSFERGPRLLPTAMKVALRRPLRHPKDARSLPDRVAQCDAVQNRALPDREAGQRDFACPPCLRALHYGVGDVSDVVQAGSRASVAAAMAHLSASHVNCSSLARRDDERFRITGGLSLR